MTKSMATLAVCLAPVIGVAFSTLAAAQVIAGLRVNLPYAAQAGGATLPAGEYVVRDVKDDGGVSILEFLSADNHTAVVVMAERIPLATPVSKTELVLHQAGEKYVMDKIWLDGRDYGYELLSGNARR
jgi:hypothetical protein